jgi:putative heme iron utilization protein
MPELKGPPDLKDVQTEASRFHKVFDSLLMATVSPEGHPVASYAPYVSDAEGCFYIYISDLAAHTSNLQRHPEVSVLFIEDESHAKHLFGRQRITYRCNAREIGREQAEFAVVLDWFEQKHGPFMTMMRTLQDFHLFCLTPESAQFVRGFGQAYEWSGANLRGIRHRNDRGHRA